jgi:succinoglycan biosynthesis transport protein ExoP
VNEGSNIIRASDPSSQNSVLAGGSAAGTSSSDKLDLRTFFGALRRHRWLSIIVATTIMVLAIAVTLRQTTLYTATTSVVIDRDQVQMAPRVQGEVADTFDSPLVDTQVAIIQSSELAGKVADSLKLDDAVIYDARAKSVGLRVRVLMFFGMAAPVSQRMFDKSAQHEYVIEQLQNGLTVARVGGTYALTISFSAPDPTFAAAIANEYARQYSALQITRERNENADTIAFLSKRIEELRQKAEDDTRAVQDYRIRNNLLSSNAVGLTEGEVSTYNQQLAGARAAAGEDRARLSTALGQLRNGSNGDDVGEALNSGVVSSLKTQRASLAAELANMKSRYGPRHPDVVRVEDQIADLDKSIQGEVDRVISNLRAKAQVSQERLSSIGGSLAQARGTLSASNKALVGFTDLSRKAETSQALYEAYLNRYKEIVAKAGTEQSSARAISWAVVPTTPSSPNVPLNMFLAVFLALGAGLASALVAELLFTGLTTGDDVEQRLGTAYLGAIPSLKSVGMGKSTIPDVVIDQPHSAISEFFRHMLTSINHAIRANAQVVLITSALPQEGKTVTSIALARVAAQSGEHVLVIDCDTRRRSLSRWLDLPGEQGLIDVLRGEMTLDSAIVRDEASGAYVLPLGRSRADRGDIVTSDAMFALLQQLRARFTYIVLDCAPVLPVTAARILAEAADAVVFVTRWRKTPDHAVRAALRLIPSDRATIAGVALTQVNLKEQSKYGVGDSTFYYEQYESYYA